MARRIYCGFNKSLSVNKVRDYIKNQEEHHRKKSFSEEFQEFIDKYGFGIIGKTGG